MIVLSEGLSPCNFRYHTQYPLDRSVLSNNGDLYIEEDRFVIDRSFPDNDFVLFDLTKKGGDVYPIPWLKNGHEIRVRLDTIHSQENEEIYQFRFLNCCRFWNGEDQILFVPGQLWTDLVFFLSKKRGIVGSYVALGKCLDDGYECTTARGGEIFGKVIDNDIWFCTEDFDIGTLLPSD
jgi:hypothetical protein